MAKIVKEFIHADQKYVGITKFYVDDEELFMDAECTVSAKYEDVYKACVAGTAYIVDVEYSSSYVAEMYENVKEFNVVCHSSTGKHKIIVKYGTSDSCTVLETGFEEES